MTITISEFEGRDVVSQTLILQGTGDGLSKAMAVKPGEHHLGETVDLLIRAEVRKVRFDPAKDSDDELVRVEIMTAQTVTIVEREFAQERIAAQEEANDLASAKAKIPYDKSVHNAADWSSDGSVVVVYDDEFRNMWPDDYDEGVDCPEVGQKLGIGTVVQLLDHVTGEPIVSPGEGDGAPIPPSPAPPSDDDWSDPPKPGLDIPSVEDLKFVDASVKDLAFEVARISDVHRLQMLRLADIQRWDGKGRVGVLKAIDARLTELGDV